MARTLLGALGHATFNFAVVVVPLFVVSCVCPKVFDLAKQQHNIFPGVSEVGENDFLVYFFLLYVFFSVLHFSLQRSRAPHSTSTWTSATSTFRRSGSQSASMRR